MAGGDKYILHGHEPAKEPDLAKWAYWFEKADRSVAATRVRKTRISTVFLGLDHNFGDGPPLLFETMIFGGKHDQYQERCSTWLEAEKQHNEAVRLVRGR